MDFVSLTLGYGGIKCNDEFVFIFFFQVAYGRTE